MWVNLVCIFRYISEILIIYLNVLGFKIKFLRFYGMENTATITSVELPSLLL
jgi:hypothetical protein